MAGFAGSGGGLRRIQRIALVTLLGGCQKLLVCCNREVERVIVMLGASERGRVVGDVSAGEVVLGEPFGYLLPAAQAVAGVRLRQGPQMPAGPVIGVGSDGA